MVVRPSWKKPAHQKIMLLDKTEQPDGDFDPFLFSTADCCTLTEPYISRGAWQFEQSEMLEILISYSESNTAMVEVGLIRNKNVCIGTNVTSSLW